jgi:Arc/MetJ-type ribon-helix-helix transcriptional regulator
VILEYVLSDFLLKTNIMRVNLSAELPDMKIELNPEDEQLIQKRLQSGAFHTVDEIIHDALTSQDAEEDWLEENKEAINAKISRGLAQLDSGEGISGDVARARLQERKAGWLSASVHDRLRTFTRS